MLRRPNALIHFLVNIFWKLFYFGWLMIRNWYARKKPKYKMKSSDAFNIQIILNIQKIIGAYRCISYWNCNLWHCSPGTAVVGGAASICSPQTAWLISQQLLTLRTHVAALPSRLPQTPVVVSVRVCAAGGWLTYFVLQTPFTELNAGDFGEKMQPDSMGQNQSGSNSVLNSH